MTDSEQIGPFLLGVYESELDEAWAKVFRSSYAQVIDIGAKFGYYAIGLAKKYPDASVVAFDTDWWARKAVGEMAAANSSGNIEVRGFCIPEWLERHVQESAFIISDCEGYESAPFGPGTIPKLKSATLIIETHDCSVPGVSDKILKAFEETHLVEVFGHNDKRRSATKPLEFLSETERQLATQEVRPPQPGYYAYPRRAGTEPVVHNRPIYNVRKPAIATIIALCCFDPSSGHVDRSSAWADFVPSLEAVQHKYYLLFIGSSPAQ